MDSLYFRNVRATPYVDSESYRAIVAAGLWIRTGMVGATTLIIGLILLFNGEATPLVATAVALGGGALAVLAWRRAWTILAKAEEHDGMPGADPVRTDRDIATQQAARDEPTPYLGSMGLFGGPPAR